MRRTATAGIALLAGVLGMAGAAGAGHETSTSVIRIGGSGATFAVTIGSPHSAHWLGTLTIDGCEFIIYECEDVEYEIVKAFRREGYRASEWRGAITVDYRRKAPDICWHSHDYDLVIEDSGWNELELCLHKGHVHQGTVIGNGGGRRDVRERVVDRHDRDSDRRGLDRDAGRRDREDRRDGRVDRRDEREDRREDRDRRDDGRREVREFVTPARPPMNLAPYQPVQNQARPKIVGAWVPEPPKE